MSAALLADRQTLQTHTAPAWPAAKGNVAAAVNQVKLVGQQDRGRFWRATSSTLSSAWLNCPASTVNTIKSTSLTAPTTVRFNDQFSALLCRV
jgi:hypothetical protein